MATPWDQGETVHTWDLGRTKGHLFAMQRPMLMDSVQGRGAAREGVRHGQAAVLECEAGEQDRRLEQTLQRWGWGACLGGA